MQVTKVVLVQRKIFNNNYQQNSRVLVAFVPNKSFGHLLDILPKILYFQDFHILKYGLQIKILNC